MNTDAALEFLRQHQPLPPTRDASDSLFRQFDSIRRYFTTELDHRAVPLLIGALGEGDGHGTYQMIETALQAYPEEVVVSALKDGLVSRHASVRYWSAQFAANYARDEMLEGLVKLFRRGGLDEKVAVVTAIERIGSSRAREKLRQLRALELEPAIRQLIDSALKA